MDLLDRYIYEVGRRLPSGQRDDITKELKSLLLDALEAKTQGREPTDDDAAQVLREFGRPEDVAARYIGDKYVIGPRFYPIYKLVLGIVSVSLAFGLFASMAIGYALDAGSGKVISDGILQFLGFGAGFGEAISGGIRRFLGSLIPGLLSAVGAVTIIFWAIESVLQRKGMTGPDAAEHWNPKSLPPAPKKQNEWKPAESIAAIVFGIIALMLFNGFPDLIAIYTTDASGQWQRFPILAQDALVAFLPYWNIGWAFGIALHAVLLAQGRWRFGTNIANIGVKVYDIFVLCVMIAGPKLLNTAVTFIASVEATETFRTVVTIVNAQFHWVLILAIVGSAVEIGKTIYRVVRDRP